MKCVHCHRELTFTSIVDRSSGSQVDVYSCVYCGAVMKENRPKRQIGR